MCGLDVPTSIYMIMSPSSICSSITVACQAHTSLRRDWRSVSPHGFLLATPPTTSPCPLPGHDPASNGPSAVPCHSRRRRFASSCRIEERLARGEQGVEYPLNVKKLFWSSLDIMHVAIAWDNKPLLLLTALLPNRTTESFQMEAGPR